MVIGISVTTDRRAVYCMDEYLALTPPAVKSWVIVQVTHIIEPNHVYVCFPYGFTSPDDDQGKNGKVFPYSLPSIGPGADPGVQAVSPQVTSSESRHRPGSRLPLLFARPVVTSIAFTRWRYL